MKNPLRREYYPIFMMEKPSLNQRNVSVFAWKTQKAKSGIRSRALSFRMQLQRREQGLPEAGRREGEIVERSQNEVFVKGFSS